MLTTWIIWNILIGAWALIGFGLSLTAENEFTSALQALCVIVLAVVILNIGIWASAWFLIYNQVWPFVPQ